jgi:GntR family transcriptional regulator
VREGPRTPSRRDEPRQSATVLAPIGQGSLADQATQMLLDAILDDGFPDRRLPPEPELAALLQVSRTTVRAALQSLERLGIVSRTPGRGTIVLPHVGRHSIALQRLVGFRALLQERYGRVDVEEDHWVESQASEDAATALGVPLDTPMVWTSKRYVADDHAAIYATAQIPLSHFAPAVQEDLVAGTPAASLFDSIFALSRSWPGRQIHHTLVELMAAVAPEGDFPLDLPPGASHLVLLETHYTSTGEAVAYGTVLLDDRTLRLQIVRHL